MNFDRVCDFARRLLELPDALYLNGKMRSTDEVSSETGLKASLQRKYSDVRLEPRQRFDIIMIL